MGAGGILCEGLQIILGGILSMQVLCWVVGLFYYGVACVGFVWVLFHFLT